MHQTTVAKAESGTRPTNVAELAAIAMIFDISIAELFDPYSGDVQMYVQLEGLAYRLAAISNEKNRLEHRMAELQAEWTSTEIERRELANQITTREQEREEQRARVNAEFEKQEKR
jgi:hypothetical protein